MKIGMSDRHGVAEIPCKFRSVPMPAARAITREALAASCASTVTISAP